MSPVEVDDVFEVGVDDFVHFVWKNCHFVFSAFDAVDVVLKEIFDAVHLVIMEAALKVTLTLVSLYCVVGSYSCTAGCGTVLDALSVHLAYFAITIDTDVRCEQQGNVTILGSVATECCPSSLASEWNSPNPSKCELLAPSIPKERGDIFARVIMVDFVRTRTVSKKCILIPVPKTI